MDTAHRRVMDIGKKQRIDKWLWYARVVKSRTLAQKLAAGGHVRVNREKIASASAQIKTGDTLTIRLARRILVYRVVDLGKRRGPAPEAQGLYEDLSPPPDPKTLPARMPKPEQPDRRQKREIRKLRGKPVV